jgi:transglutaminase-like putative cysteine protease
MVVAAVLTLAMAGALSPVSIGVLFAVGCLSWHADPETRVAAFVAKTDVAFKLGALAYFLFTVYRVASAFPEPDLATLLDFVLFLVGYKLLQRRSGRDYLQIYILSFLLLLASAWLAQGALFAVGFSCYAVLATWALILFHLRREIEENYLVKHLPESATQRVTVARVLDSRRVVSAAFFGVTALVAMGVLAGSALIFAVAPRIGVGFLTGGMRRKANVVGFTDEVRLGHHGVLSSDNNTVVLRVTMPRITDAASAEERELKVANLYWRGTVYDKYEDGQWLRSRRGAVATGVDVVISPEGSRISLIRSPEAAEKRDRYRAVLANADRQEIRVVGLSHPVAFALDQPVAYEVPQPPLGSFLSTRIEPRWGDESALQMIRLTPSGRTIPLADFTGAHYIAYSRDSLKRIDPARAKKTEELPERLLKTYLAVPSSLSPRVAALARRITEGRTQPAAKAAAVVDWLHRNKTYTTDLKRNPDIADPLEDFLFEQKAGHCEYFASAAAVLMRLSGVPTRYVNGFLGGEWNAIGNHITVRDNRAHSWIEAYFSGFGWTRFDATPALMRSSRMARMQQLIDSLELWWTRWVLDYNASRQIELAQGLAKKIGLRRQGSSRFSLPRVRLEHVLWIVGGVATVFIVARTWRRRTSSQTADPGRRWTDDPVCRLYERALRVMAGRGVVRGPSETPRELLARVLRDDPAAGPALSAITRIYERVRYGAEEPAGLPDLERALAVLENAERTKKAA